MKTTLNVSTRDSALLEEVYARFYTREMCDKPVDWPSPMIIRQSSLNAPVVRATYTPNFRRDYVDLEVVYENSAMFKDFTLATRNFSIRFLGAGDLQKDKPLLKTPADPALMAYLNGVNTDAGENAGTTRLQAFKMMYYVCSTVLAYFPECFEAKQISESEKVCSVRKDILTIAEAKYRESEKQRLEDFYAGWDTVTLTAQEMNQIRWYLHSNEIQRTQIRNLALDKFSLRYINPPKNKDFNQVQVVFFDAVSDTRLKVRATTEEHPERETCFEVEEVKDTDGEWVIRLVEDGSITKDQIAWLNGTISGMDGQTRFWWILEMFFAVNDYMLHAPKSFDVKEVEYKGTSKSKGTTRRSETGSERNTIRLYRAFTFKNLPHRGDGTKTMVYHCEAWGVMGHYRRCRSGKLVYVRPYVKGRKKDEYKGKEYRLIQPVPEEGRAAKP